MLLKGREGRRGREGANGRGARIAAARQSECVANTMHISHCSWPPPFLRKGKNDSAKHCSRLHSWVHQVQSGRVLAWLQSKQNWPFLRLYLPLILLHLFSSPGYPRRLPRQRRPTPWPTSKSIRGARGNPRCFPAHGRAREGGRSAVSRTNLHAVEDSHRGREKILPGMTKICK